MHRLITSSIKTKTNAGLVGTRSCILRSVKSPSAEMQTAIASITAKNEPELELRAKLTRVDQQQDSVMSSTSAAILQVEFPGIMPVFSDVLALNGPCKTLILSNKKDGNMRAGRLRLETLATGDVLLVKYISGKCVEHAIYHKNTKQLAVRFYANGCGQVLAKLRAAKLKEAQLSGSVQPRFVMIASTNDFKASSSFKASVKGPQNEAVVEVLDLKDSPGQAFASYSASGSCHDFRFQLDKEVGEEVDQVLNLVRTTAEYGNAGAYKLLWSSLDAAITDSKSKPVVNSWDATDDSSCLDEELLQIEDGHFRVLFETVFRS